MKQAILILVVTLTAMTIASTSAAYTPRKGIKASDHAKVITATWRCQDKIPVTRTENHYYPWVPHSQGFRRAQVIKWSVRHKKCQAFLKERARQWNWQRFPSWIIDLAVCETGGSGRARPGEPNWFAEGSSSHGTFYSAFNIGRSRYDAAAHSVGMRGWHEGPGVPSPYEQAWTVIGYARTIGDGFAGNCHGIVQKSWN